MQTYYLRARHFNPRTGRFTQPDPFWNIHNMTGSRNAVLQSSNLFVYTMNNPVMWVDPSGNVAIPALLPLLPKVAPGVAQGVANIFTLIVGGGAIASSPSTGLSTSTQPRPIGSSVSSLPRSQGSISTSQICTATSGTSSIPGYSLAQGYMRVQSVGTNTTTSTVVPPVAGGVSVGAVIVVGHGSSTGGTGDVAIPGGISFPGNDPTVSPGQDFEWRGRGEPGSGRGSWYNPNTGESFHPDLDHPQPIGPHWDHQDADGNKSRVFPDGTVEPKNPPREN